MNRKEISEFLNQSFDDERLSRNETAVFKQLLEEASPDANDLAWLRHQIFDTAQNAIHDPRDRNVLSWVEELCKALATQHSPQNTHQEALFFPGPNSLRRVIELLSSARKTLEICVFTITNDQISNVIIDAHRRGVKVRVITDDDKSLDLGSDAERMLQAGIPVRFDRTPNHMHHKFSLVDRVWLLNGSFNWTRSASTHNHENVQITDDPKFNRLFLDEFEKLWAEFSP